MLSKSAQAISRAFRLSKRLSVEITAGASGLVCEWEPDMPDQLTPRELRAYRKARDEMLRKVSERLGIPVSCVEVR
jgi:hypothetical protein